MNNRRNALKFIAEHLGARDVYWGGLRSDDVEAISDLPNLAGSFSIIGGHERGGAVPGIDFEDLSGERVDVDAWDLDDHIGTAAVREFREALLHSLSGNAALLPYRPTNFLSSVAFARRDRCLNLGLFGGHQALFEHKPWVESNVAELGIPCVPWVYVADEEQARVRRMLAHGPVMLRTSRSSGGAGLVRVDDPSDLQRSWPRQSDGFASVSPMLEDALPINVGATVWHDGVTLSHASVQLIGVGECTHRPFGYCGNDFGAAGDLDPGVIDGLEASVKRIGRWMRSYGYVGTFGVDFLLHEGTALFTEVNARFQGSTQASSQISGEQGESCVMLDHIAATLGGDTPNRVRLRELTSSVPKFAHFIIHSTAEAPAFVDVSGLVVALKSLPQVRRVDVAAKPHIITHPGGVILRATAQARVTTTGFELSEPMRSSVQEWQKHHAERVL